MGMYMKIGWRPLQVRNIPKIYNNNYSNNNNKNKNVYMLLDCRWKEWRHNLHLQCSDHQNYKYQLVDQDLQRDNHLNLGWGVD
jgi:hypothetical protein